MSRREVMNDPKAGASRKEALAEIKARVNSLRVRRRGGGRRWEVAGGTAASLAGRRGSGRPFGRVCVCAWRALLALCTLHGRQLACVYALLPLPTPPPTHPTPAFPPGARTFVARGQAAAGAPAQGEATRPPASGCCAPAPSCLLGVIHRHCHRADRPSPPRPKRAQYHATPRARPACLARLRCAALLRLGRIRQGGGALRSNAVVVAMGKATRSHTQFQKRTDCTPMPCTTRYTHCRRRARWWP